MTARDIRDDATRRALFYLAEYKALRRAVSATLATGDALYGDHGALIAGGFRDHWPATIKDSIRAQHRAVNAASDRAFAEWRAARRLAHTLRRALQDDAEHARLVKRCAARARLEVRS